jgi:hypothetical protein
LGERGAFSAEISQAQYPAVNPMQAIRGERPGRLSQ